MPQNSPSKPAQAFLYVVLALVALLFVSSGGDFTPAHWTAFYVGTALITGIAFWAFTHSPNSHTTLAMLGIRLGGGAGIGAAFMLLASNMAGSAPVQANSKYNLEGVYDVMQFENEEGKTGEPSLERRGKAAISQMPGSSDLVVTVTLEDPWTVLDCPVGKVVDGNQVFVYYKATGHPDKGVMEGAINPADPSIIEFTYTDLEGTSGETSSRGSMRFTRCADS